MSLKEYRRKRDFERTDEPAGNDLPTHGALYVIQKHAASHLHYDFRLELGGVLKSWAVPKGPSLDPRVKSLAVHVEDHPIEYGSFEGTIPQGEYGGGTVMLWDCGTWESEGNAADDYQKGKLVFRLNGKRLKGHWALIRMGGKAGAGGKNWLLKKLEDDEARPDDNNILNTNTISVVSNRTMDEIADNVKAPSKSRRSSKSSANSAIGPEAATRSTRRSLDPSSLPGAKQSAMPNELSPELPLLVEQLPRDANWLYELKLDGYRMICFVKDGKVSLRTRRGNDWTHRFPTIAIAIEKLGLDDAILDGEIVALKPDGTTDFQALQNMMRQGNLSHLVFFVFDLIYYDGHDLRQVALIERKRLLAKLIAENRLSRIVRYSDHIAGQGTQVFESACEHALEGIVAKRADSHYSERRSSDWVKVKCLKRQEFVIGGWTDPGGDRDFLGALLLGYYRGRSDLVYCGRVGTGFTAESLRELQESLRLIEQSQCPFHKRPAGVASRGVIHWAAPRLVAEVAFVAWTTDRVLRHASFQGIREDKDPREITLEAPASGLSSGTRKRATTQTLSNAAPVRARNVQPGVQRDQANEFAGIRLTHPDRILFPDEQITKRDVAAYYTAVASVMLPHVVDRPLSLLRCPDGSMKPCFYQKHLGSTMPEAVRGISIKEKKGTAIYMVIADLAGLISLVQMGVLEIHPWGSRQDRIDQPDRLIFDIDPAEDLAWEGVKQAASVIKGRLEQLGLEGFLRTTGGKGLHVVVPIARRISWQDLKTIAKAFVDVIVRDQPNRYIAQASKAKRPGKIYLDYLRNERGATAVASYSTRARSGATVATPIAWNELFASSQRLQFDTRTVPERLQNSKQDPWNGFFDLRQAITREIRTKINRW